MNKPHNLFLIQTQPLKKWSEAHECHFYVKIYDDTDGDKKKLYQQQLKIVENSFYKALI